MQEPQYKSGATVAQRAPIYIDVNKDPRARDQAYLNLYSSRVGAPVIAVDSKTGIYLGSSTVQDNITAASGNGTGPSQSGAGGTSIDGLPTKGVPPLSITNLKADYVGDDIVVTFDWDSTDAANQNIYKFKVEVHDSVANSYFFLLADIGYDPSKFISSSSVHQTLTLLSKDLQLSGTDNPTAIDIVGVAVSDIVNNGSYVTINVTTPWQSSLPAPILGDVTNATDSYSIPITNYSTAKIIGAFDGVIVQENLTSLSDQNAIDDSKWTLAMPAFDASTITGFVPDDAPRWIRAKFYQKNGGLSLSSNVKKAEPLAFMPVNTNPPAQFSAGTLAWSGNDLVVGFTVPGTIPSGQSAPVQVKVKIVPFVNGVESTSLYSYYYHIINTGETQFIIKSADLYAQFGTYYSKFKGYVTSVSAQGVETLGSVISVGPVTRANTLASVQPTVGTPNTNSPTGVFRVTAISNGYVVDFDMPAGATKLEVYEKSTAWTGQPIDDSNMVFRGTSPGTVIAADTSIRYVIVHYYDDYGNYSHYSNEASGQISGVAVTPLDVGKLTLVDNPIKISTDGSIFSGAGDQTVYPQVFFNKDGLFAYDSSGNWTTEIINNASTNAPTFFTKRAVIGDWTISPTGIQNDLYVGSSTYTGMSASGTYAFWAGADASNNSDGLAKFSVTPAGAVKASNISIVGTGSGTSNLISAGSNFSVDQSGNIKAHNADLSGSLNITGQSYFSANVNISSGSYLISQGTGTVKVGSEGLLAMSGSSATTKIYSSPITVNGHSISMWSKGALFGSSEASGWVVADGQIISSHIVMDSGAEYIRITGSDPANGVKISYASGQASDFVIQAGAIDSGNPYFSVTHDGTINAQKANITGTVSSSIIKSSGKTGINDSNNGYYFNTAGDFEIKNSGGTMTFGSVPGQSAFNISMNSSGSISLTALNPGSGDRAYSVTSFGVKIGSGYNGVLISGLPIQGNFITNAYGYQQPITQSGYYDQSGILHDTTVSGDTPYLGAAPLGAVGRQRMVVESPISGTLSLGMAVYYEDTSGVHTSNPSSTSGYIGDLWVQY